MIHKAWCNVEEVPYNFLMSSIKFEGHTGWKIDNFNPIWVRLLGRSQLSNPSDLPCSRGRWVKLRSHMHRAVAERRRADFDIPPLLLWVCSHIRREDVGGSVISSGQRWFGVRGFEADAEKLVLDPFVAERILLPLCLRSANEHVWTHVMICVEAIFPPASARIGSAHVWTYLKSPELALPGHWE